MKLEWHRRPLFESIADDLALFIEKIDAAHFGMCGKGDKLTSYLCIQGLGTQIKLFLASTTMERPSGVSSAREASWASLSQFLFIETPERAKTRWPCGCQE